MKTFRAPNCARLVPMALVSLLLALQVLGIASPVMAQPPSDSVAEPEVRALWVTRFVWPDRENPQNSRANITRILDEMKVAGFNVALFQVRGECETLYPSSLEPWSPLIGGQDPGFDPLAFAIEEAHARDIELHAYINPIPLHPTSGGRAPANPQHLFYRHGPDTAEPWVAVDEQGEPATSEYFYLSPGIPQVHAYIREVVRDLATRYNLDGIHIDRIRYPGREYSYDAISRARFAGRGNPSHLEWAEWQREQLNKLVNDMAAEIRAINPEIVFSAAVWGIYRRDHIEGYAGFSSGYHDYAQDSWQWVKLGAMDALAPMIYWDIPEPKPNYHELMEDFIGGVGGEAFWGGLRRFAGRPEETVAQIERTRAAGGAGTVIFAYRNQADGSPDDFPHLREGVYATPAPVPVLQRLVAPATGGVLGTVVDSAGTPVTDAWARISPASGHSAPEAEVFRLVWTSSADGRFAFMNVPPGPVLIEVSGDGVSASSSVLIEAGKMSGITLELPAVLVARGELPPPTELAVVRPANDSTTTAERVNIIGRTEPGTTVTIGGEPAQVFSTGVFVRDLVPLEPGENLIDVVGVSASGGRLTQTLRVVREQPSAPAAAETPAPVRPRFTSPDESLIVRTGDDVTVRVLAPAGATAVLHLGSLALPLTATGGEGLVEHRATFVIPSSLSAGMSAAKLTAHVTLPGESEPVVVESPETLEVWAEHRVVMAQSTSARTSLMHGIHGVRLGGPFVTELPEGIHLRLTGARGNRYRVMLAPGQTGWVDRREVSLLPEGTPIPRGYFTSVSIGSGEGIDSVRLGVPATMPHAVRAEIAPNRIELDLFGAHHAATWVSHRSAARVVGSISIRQLGDEHLRVTIPVNTRMIWGYYVERSGNSLAVHVRHAPDIAFGEGVSPLQGLLIAVEAGHGGRDAGAVGFTGAAERDVNRAAADAFEQALLARGARVVQVRPGDEGLSLSERAQAANDAGAHLYVSIHANAAGTDRGYLRVSGTSMYYKEDHCALPARLIYEELLTLGWPEFGVVGNFNYLPLRNSRVPAVLVEQAFMSHPGDEARLLDPEYQRQQAEAITRGLERFLLQVAE